MIFDETDESQKLLISVHQLRKIKRLVEAYKSPKKYGTKVV